MNTNSLTKKITALSVVLVVLLIVASSIDDLLAAPLEEAGDESSVTETTGEKGKTTGGDEESGDPLKHHGRDLEAEQAVLDRFVTKSLEPTLTKAVAALPELPADWVRPVFKEEVFPEDEDEDIALYEDLFTVDGGGRLAGKEEQDEFARLFAKTMVDNPAEEPPQKTDKDEARPASRAKNATARKKTPRTKSQERTKVKAKSAPPPEPAKTDKAPPPAQPEDKAPAVGTPKELLAMAKKKLRSGNPKGAEVLYRQVLSKNPGNLKARYGLAKALYASNRVPFARKELGRVLAVRGSHGGALLMMGSILQSQGKKAAAKNYYKKYLDTHPNGRRADEIRSILSRLQ